MKKKTIISWKAGINGLLACFVGSFVGWGFFWFNRVFFPNGFSVMFDMWYSHVLSVAVGLMIGAIWIKTYFK